MSINYLSYHEFLMAADYPPKLTEDKKFRYIVHRSCLCYHSDNPLPLFNHGFLDEKKKATRVFCHI